MTDAAADLRALSADVAELPLRLLIDVAKAAKQIVNDEGRRVAGPDGMKGKKKRGLKLKSRDDIRQHGRAASVRIQGSVPGWIWASTGTAPHTIRRRKKGKKRKMTVHHPGTRGRGAWDRVEKRIVDELDAAIVDRVAKVKW